MEISIYVEGFENQTHNGYHETRNLSNYSLSIVKSTLQTIHRFEVLSKICSWKHANVILIRFNCNDFSSIIH